MQNAYTNHISTEPLHWQIGIIMNECELIALVSTFACGIAKCCSQNEITIMAVIFTQLGDTLATILAYRELAETGKNEPVLPPILPEDEAGDTAGQP